MTLANLRNVATATSTLACALLLSFGWSGQGGISLSIESAQAQVDRPLTSPSVVRRHDWRAAHDDGAGIVGASLVAGPWDYYGGTPCDYERVLGGYYRGAGWDRYWSCGPGAYCGSGSW
jgi:hypothetical protein